MYNEKITAKDVLDVAREEMNVCLDTIKIAPNRNEISPNNFNYEKDISDTLLSTCPHCSKYSSLDFNNEEKKISILRLATYSKETPRSYHISLIMCPKCRKDYVSIMFKDDRFTFEKDDIIEDSSKYRHAIAYNSDAEAYTIEELEKGDNWQYIKDIVQK